VGKGDGHGDGDGNGDGDGMGESVVERFERRWMEGCSVFEMRDSLGGVLGGDCDYVFAEPDWL